MKNGSFGIKQPNSLFRTMQELATIHRGALTQPLTRGKGVSLGASAQSYMSHKADGRLYALDLARFLAMVFMVQGHVLDTLTTSATINVDVAPWNVWHWIRGLTAPIFLMVSGAAHAFASKRGEDGFIRADIIQRRIRWAITIMGLGYLMAFPANRIWDLPFVPPSGWQQFSAVNILQLTGVALLLFVLTLASTKSVREMGYRAVLIGVAIVAAAPIASLPALSSGLPIWLTAYLNTATGSLFPVFPFAAYLFFGVAFGAYLVEVPAEHRDGQIVRVGLVVGITLASVALTIHHLLLANGVDGSVIESPVSPLLAVRRVGLVLMVFAGAVYVLRATYRWRNWYVLFGTRSLYIYVIHLAILYGTPWWDGIGRTQFRQFSLASSAMIMMSILVSTLFIAWAIDAFNRSEVRPGIKKAVRWSLSAVLVYMLVV